MEEYRGSYEAAMKAIELGLKLNRRGEVLSIDQFGSYALIYDALNPQVIVQFCAVRLKKLIIYDIDHNSQLVETLRKFLNNRGNSYKTARDMNMSFSGFKYRLSRIEEISGQDLRNTQEFYNLSLALDILDLMGAEAVLGAGI